MLYLDGGIVLGRAADAVEFVGFTASAFTGDLGGYHGANAKCSADFPGGYLCTQLDYDQANSTVTPPAAGAWIDTVRSTDGLRRANSCFPNSGTNPPWTYGGGATGSSGQSGMVLSAQGSYLFTLCNQTRPLACCRGASRSVFRGFTVSAFTGDLGGYHGANAKCSADFPGAFLCTQWDYDQANGSATPPAAGAWIDTVRSTDGLRRANSCFPNSGTNPPWTYGGGATGSSGQSGMVLSAQGSYLFTLCNQTRPLACCSKP